MTYIKNRIPHRGNPKGIPPIMLLHGTKRPIDLRHVRKFYSYVYVKRVKIVRGNEMDPVAELGRFVGLDPRRMGYRVLLPSGKVIIRRDVVFPKDVTPLDTSNTPKPASTPDTVEIQGEFIPTSFPHQNFEPHQGAEDQKQEHKHQDQVQRCPSRGTTPPPAHR